ncbi:uncharacterized protein LOC142337215 isoform X2 [Convolutriloba macropyga]|uniref:uncharacterized protein LOC142337215 isoform X2 n=1 Tax=Convolutriloba macropyga TaxID=536237 RepID=UPI003F52674C
MYTNKGSEVLDLELREQKTRDRLIVRNHIRADRQLERQKSAFHKRENNQRRRMEEKQREIRKPEVTEVPNEFKMTDEDFFAEFAASSCFSRKSTVAPRSLSVGDGGMASTSTPLRGRSARRAVTLNLEIPKMNIMSEESSAIYKDLQSYVRKWRNPPHSIIGGHNKARLEKILRELAYDISQDGREWRRIQSAATTGRSSSPSMRRPHDGRPPTCGPGSKIYEKQQWLAQQIEEWEARRTEEEKERQAKEETERRERAERFRLNRGRGSNLWAMLQKSLLVTNKYITQVQEKNPLYDLNETQSTTGNHSRPSTVARNRRPDTSSDQSGNTSRARSRGESRRRMSQQTSTGKRSSLFYSTASVVFQDIKKTLILGKREGNVSL